MLENNDKYFEVLNDIKKTLITTRNKIVESANKDLVDYVHSLKGKCKIGIFADLIYCCSPALDSQVDLKQFDYVWVSFITHVRKNEEPAFQIVEQDLQTSPNNIMFVDDTSINIENAKKRGWNTCQAFGYELDKIKQSVEQFLTQDLNYNINNTFRRL